MAKVLLYGDYHGEEFDKAEDKMEDYLSEDVEALILENPNEISPKYGRWIYFANPLFSVWFLVLNLLRAILHYIEHRDPELKSAGEAVANRLRESLEIPLTYTDIHWRDWIANQGLLLTITEIVLLLTYVRIYRQVPPVTAISLILFSSLCYFVLFFFWIFPLREGKMARDTQRTVNQNDYSAVALITGDSHVNQIRARLEDLGLDVEVRHHEKGKSEVPFRRVLEWGR